MLNPHQQQQKTHHIIALRLQQSNDNRITITIAKINLKKPENDTMRHEMNAKSTHLCIFMSHLCLYTLYIQCIQFYILMSHCNGWEKEVQFEINDNIWRCLCLLLLVFCRDILPLFLYVLYYFICEELHNLFCGLDFSYLLKFSIYTFSKCFSIFHFNLNMTLWMT